MRSLDRDQERELAERYSRGDQDWLAARYRLIDEVLEYRRTGTLSQSLLDACEAEFAVASWANSEGIRRLVELEADGHAAPAARLEDLRSSKDWRARYEALRTSFERTEDLASRRLLLTRGLSDPSARIRRRMAAEAVFAHLIDTADEIERAASVEGEEKNAKALFDAAHQLRTNEQSGNIGVFGGSVQDTSKREAAWDRFKAEHRHQSA